MTIQNDVVLWDSDKDTLSLFQVPMEQQYRYIDRLPCITIGVSYENETHKGRDIFTFFDHHYVELMDTMKKTSRCLDGAFRLYDMGADTDGYIDFEIKDGKMRIKGQLGASFSSHSLKFHFDADQTLLDALIQSLSI